MFGLIWRLGTEEEQNPLWPVVWALALTLYVTAIVAVIALGCFFPDGDERWKKLPGRRRFWRTMGIHFPVLVFVGVYEFALRPFVRLAYIGALGPELTESALSIGTALLLVHTPPGVIGVAFAALVIAAAWSQSRKVESQMTGAFNGAVFVLGVAILIAIPFGLVASFW